jgi:hypothetical protein
MFPLYLLLVPAAFGSGAGAFVPMMNTVNLKLFAFLPSDFDNNPGYSGAPCPPKEPPTGRVLENNPAVKFLALQSDNASAALDAPSDAETETDPKEELKVQSLTTNNVKVERNRTAKDTKKEYNELGVLAGAVGKIALGGSKAAIFGLKAFVDTMAAPSQKSGNMSGLESKEEIELF